MSGYFQQAEEAARHSRMCYVNADIVLFPDLLEAVAKVDLAKFVMGGRRTDYDIEKPVDFTRPDWAEALREDAEQNGTLHDFSAIDYFVYPRGMFGEIPQFALGRWYWDNWLVYGVPSGSRSAAGSPARSKGSRWPHTRTTSTSRY